MSQWWVSRSSSAGVIFASPNTLGHSPKAKSGDDDRNWTSPLAMPLRRSLWLAPIVMMAFSQIFELQSSVRFSGIAPHHRSPTSATRPAGQDLWAAFSRPECLTLPLQTQPNASLLDNVITQFGNAGAWNNQDAPQWLAGKPNLRRRRAFSAIRHQSGNSLSHVLRSACRNCSRPPSEVTDCRGHDREFLRRIDGRSNGSSVTSGMAAVALG